MRWYLRYGLSYRDVEELLAERGIQVDLVTSQPVSHALVLAAARPAHAVFAPHGAPGVAPFLRTKEAFRRIGGLR